MTYLELIKTLKSISLSQPNVHSFVRQFDDLNREDTVYSAIILQDQQHVQAGDFINYSFYISYTDRLVENNSNEDSIISTAISIINNIVNTLREIYPYDVYLSNYNIFQQRFTALCAGAYSTITISIPAALCAEDISGLDTLSTTITSNGDYNFIPDGLGFDSVHVVVDVQPEVSLEEKSISINENGQVVVTTTPGFTGMSKVNINVAVPQEGYKEGYDEGYSKGHQEGVTEGYADGVATQKSKLQDITIARNGIYDREDGYKHIVVNVPASAEAEGYTININENGTFTYTPQEGVVWNSVTVIANVPTEGGYQEGYEAGYTAGHEAGYTEGYTAGHEVGKAEGISEQKAKLGSIEITTNGTYEKEDGYNRVVVNVEHEVNLQEKTTNPATTTVEVTPDLGFDGLSKVTVNPVDSNIDPNIVPENIKTGVTILGVEGSHKGEKPEETFNVQPSTVEQTITPTEGSVFSRGTVKAVTSAIDNNIQPANIKEGVTVLGVEGTLKEVKPEEIFDVQPSTVDQTITPTEGKVFSGGTVRAVTSDIDKNIVSNNIREGVTVLGVEGTLKEVKPEEIFDVQPSTVEQTIIPRAGYVFRGGIVKAVTAEIDENIKSNNIREGVTVLGVEGTLKEGEPNYRYMSGNVDRNGLRALGWTEEDIFRYEQNTPHYPWQNDQYIVSDENKNLYLLDDPNPDSYKNDPTVTFVPNKNMDTYFNSGTFENMKYIKGLPFYNCTRTDMTNMFKGCSNLTTIPFLDTSNVTEMTYLFAGCSNLVAIPQLNTSKVTHMGAMFSGCTSLTTIPLLDTSSAKYMTYMFNACKNLIEIPQIDTSNVLDISHMFDRCSRLTSIPMLNTSKTTAMHGLFYGCTNLTEVPQLNTSSTTDMTSMFENCTSLTTIPLLDTSNVSDARSMFYGCTSLTTVPQMDFSSATDVIAMFRGCTNLTEVPQMNLSWAQYVDDMFNGCTSLTTVHPLNTSGAMRMKYMFTGCTSLTTVEGINFSGLQEPLTYLFGTSTSMSNIKRFIVNGWIDVNIKDNYSIKALTAIDYDSVKSILEAADRTTKTNSRTLAFNRTMSDPDRELRILVSSCMSKGWSITGLTLQ